MKMLLLLLMMLLTMSCTVSKTADTIYFNGTILTMSDQQNNVEALAIEKGKIIAVGTLDEILTYSNSTTKMIDLGDKALLPGFIDPHSHSFGIGMQSFAANLYPYPDGTITNIADIKTALMKYYNSNPELYKNINWIVGFGYDDSMLQEKRHPTKIDLDEIFPDIPVYLIHQSGHIGVANSKALDILNITADTPDPEGGIIQRMTNSQDPNGVLEESIHFKVFYEVGKFSPIFASKMFLKGVNLMAANGYTTAQEARASDSQILLIKLLSIFKLLPIDILVYPDFEAGSKWLNKFSTNYSSRFRIGGVKLTLDGSPQGKTAWRDRPYVVAPHGHSHNYVGFPAINTNEAYNVINESFKNNYPIIIHANGEAAIDLFIEGIDQANKLYPDNKQRPVLIHGQFMRKDHVEKLKNINAYSSLFPLHTYYWGDWHKEQTIGIPRVNNISPTKWLLDSGQTFTIHHDAPVVVPNSRMVLWSAVNRLSRTDKVIGESQRISTLTALKAITIWSAKQIAEEDLKGSLEVGKLADLVILSQNPLNINPKDLTNITIVETLKENKSVYKAQ